MSNSQLDNVTGKGAPQRSSPFANESQPWTEFSLTLHNGNSDITLHTITIRIIATEGDEETTKVYTKRVNVSPNSVRSTNIDIMPFKTSSSSDWSWVIQSGTYTN